jgi:hypothetical protein
MYPQSSGEPGGNYILHIPWRALLQKLPNSLGKRQYNDGWGHRFLERVRRSHNMVRDLLWLVYGYFSLAFCFVNSSVLLSISP